MDNTRLFRNISTSVFVVTFFFHPLIVDSSETSAFSPGTSNFQHGLYLKAVRDLKAEILGNPVQAGLYNYLGLSYLQLKKYPESIKAFQGLIKVQSDFPEGYLNLGIAYYQSSQYQESLQSFDKALIVNPKSGGAHFFTGLVFKELKKSDQALESLAKAGPLDPNYLALSEFHRGLIFFQQKRFKEATEAFNKALQADPDGKLAGSINTMLETAKKKEEEKSWSVSLRAGVAYDDSVTLTDVDASTGLDDYFTYYIFSGRYKALEGEDYSLVFGYNFFENFYETLSAFDIQLHSGSVYGSKTILGINFDLKYLYNYIFLATEDFEVAHTGILGINIELTDWWFLRLAYAYSHKDFIDLNTRDGTNQALKLSNYFSIGKDGLIWVSYSADEEATRASEFRYFGQDLSAGFAYTLKWFNLRTIIGTNYGYRIRDYLHDTPSIGLERFDTRRILAATLTQPLFWDFDLKLQYQKVDSTSNLAASDYKESVYKVSLGFSY